jgi:hypothetical protein
LVHHVTGRIFERLNVNVAKVQH